MKSIYKVLSRRSLKDWFVATLVLTVAVKFLLAAVTPIFTEEAYWVDWAEHLDLGYFDHPPLIAWLIYPLLLLGKIEVIVRLPAIFFSAFIGVGIYTLLKEFDRNKAYLIAIFFLVSPAAIFNCFITHNTPLELFSFYSGFFLFKALRTRKLVFYALSGVLLGLAFLSKYLAALIGIGYLLYFLFSRKEKIKISGFLVLCLFCLPFIVITVYWNYNHCWYTINGHLTRYLHENRDFAIEKPISLLLTFIYLASPPALYYLVRNWKNPLKIKEPVYLGLFFFVFLLPMSFYAFSSFKVLIGLHWVFAFFSFYFLLLFFFLKEKHFITSIKFNLAFSLIHVVVFLGLVLSPLKWWEKWDDYYLIVFWRHADEVAEHFEPYRKAGFLLTTYDYTASAVMAFYMDRYFATFGNAGFFGRQDDLLTDYRKLDGKNISILIEFKKDAKKFVDYFEHTEIKAYSVHNTQLYILLGYNFKYSVYKEKHLKTVLRKYYQTPDYLPMKSCAFIENYAKDP